MKLFDLVSNKTLSSVQVFESQFKITQISLDLDTIIVQTERQYAVYTHNLDKLASYQCQDTILRIRNHAILLQHNFVIKDNHKFECMQEAYCLLYSGDLTKDLVVAGTVFRSILVWQIDSGQLLRKLEGHTGVIFDVAIINNSVASVSDDRSVRFWSGALSDTYVNEQCVMYGHTARVWKVLAY